VGEELLVTDWSLPRDGVESVVTIGKFDGVHLGHQRVIAELRAHAHGRRVVAVTFDRHPLALFDPARAPKPLLSVAQKVEALEAAGADLVVVMPFTEEFAAQSPEEFVRDVLVEGLNARLILVGKDFRYGSGGAGDVSALTTAGDESGFEVVIADDVCVEGDEKVSSSAIREALLDGDVDRAARLLGRAHRVRGLVVHGHQRGRNLGYPTVNLEENCEGFIPRPGVYSGRVVVDAGDFVAGISVGKNPTFTDVTRDQVEAHALDAEFDAYGQTAEIAFETRIRDIVSFSSVEELIEAIHEDIRVIRRMTN
jgi:riboflavin kinase/FMN adenylyltransferase